MKKLIRITSVPLSMEKLLGSQLSYMKGFYEVTAVSSNEPQLKNVAEKLGVRYHAVEMTREVTPLKDLKAIYKMYRFFRDTKPDIVHSHTPKAGLVSMVAAFLARVPVRLHTVAGLPLLEARGYKRKMLSAVEAFTYSFCTKIYPNSAELQKIILSERFCKEEKLKVLGNGSSNGIDLAHFDTQRITAHEKMKLRAKLGISEGDFVFVFLGRIVKDKGINELVSAFKGLTDAPETARLLPSSPRLKRSAARDSPSSHQPRFLPAIGSTRGQRFFSVDSRTGLRLRQRLGKVLYHEASVSLTAPSFSGFESEYGFGTMGDIDPVQHQQEFPGIKLLLVGAMEQELNPISRVTLSEIKKNKQIITTDFVQDVRPYLSISDCLVLPSYREGFPNVVLQAGAMGLPSIVTDINGCNEIIDHEITGLIVPVKDETALQGAMKMVVQDDKAFGKLKLRARAKIVEKYSQEKIWEALLAEYQAAEHPLK